MTNSQAAPGIVGPFAGLDVPWLLRMRAESRAKQVMRICDVRYPIAHGLADSVFQRTAAVRDAGHFGPE